MTNALGLDPDVDIICWCKGARGWSGEREKT